MEKKKMCVCECDIVENHTLNSMICKKLWWNGTIKNSTNQNNVDDYSIYSALRINVFFKL